MNGIWRQVDCGRVAMIFYNEGYLQRMQGRTFGHIIIASVKDEPDKNTFETEDTVSDIYRLRKRFILIELYLY